MTSAKFVAILILLWLAIACGVAVSGRIDVGPETASPCPEPQSPQGGTK